MNSPRSTDHVVVRPARQDDLPRLMKLYEELAALQEPWRVFPVRANLAEQTEHRFEASLLDPDAVLVVAERGDRIVGMAEGHLHRPSTMSDQLAVELGSVFVDPEHRGQGVARALTTEVARFAGDRGVDRLTLKTFALNREALVAWERLGFQPRMVQMTASVDELRDISTSRPRHPHTRGSA